MDLIRCSEKLMAMDDKAWQRHANPLSVYTRFTTLPLISLAVWSREVVGIYAVILIALAILWIWLNPRLFPAPRSTNNWASMATFGERIYLNRKNETAIPEHHKKACTILIILQLSGFPCWLYGLYSLNLWALFSGALWLMVTKAWLVDRMVWLYSDVKNCNPVYQSWLKE